MIALGGNAIHGDASIRRAATSIARLYSKGNDVIVTHGNGPQVGQLAESLDLGLAILTAQTQAWIGIEIENMIAEGLSGLGLESDYMVPEVVLTRTVVDGKSPAFRNPSKPIGGFYTKRQAEGLSRKGYVMGKFMKGYRRVVPSPDPQEIVEARLIEGMLRDRKIVIACGGGGIPVLRTSKGLDYAEAVVDKDKASSLLASTVKADVFLILTDVDGAYLDFGRRSQRMIGRASAGEMGRYLVAGSFEEGSMKPKVEACISFAESTGKPAVIGSLSRPENAIALKGVTVVMDG